MVSVIIPAYNVEKYIWKCLESLSRQTCRDFEAIVVVDGATDNTFALCERFAQTDSRFVVLTRENGGLAIARNTGLDRARGEYISFVDADDYVSPDFLQTLLDGLMQNDCDISACGYVLEEDNGSEIYRTNLAERLLESKDFLNHALIPINLSYGMFACNKLYKASIIKNHHVRFPNKRVMFEDHAFNFQYLKFAEKGCVVSACPYHYVSRKNTGLIRGVDKSGFGTYKWVHYTEVFDELLNDSDSGYDEFKDQIKIMKAWHSATAVRVLAFMNETGSKEYKAMRRYLREIMFVYLKTPYIGIKKKLGLVLSYYAPRLAYRVWAR